MVKPQGAIILVGAGKMGGALLEGWLAQGIKANRIKVIEANAAQATLLAERYLLEVSPNVGALSLTVPPAAVILAVKPQQMAAALQDYAAFAAQGTVFISIAAGKTVDFFTRHLGQDAAIVRAMPNLPATVQQGATVLYASTSVSEEQKQLASALFNAVGTQNWIENETLMDAVTALSGSGPAYVFLLAEAMLEAGKTLGLPEELANALTRQTLLGSTELLAQAAESPGLLREHVTSPGGTTEAALRILMGEYGIKSLLAQAMQAAAERSHELAE